MGLTRITMSGGMLAVAVVAGLAVQPVSAGGYVSVSFGIGSSGPCYTPPPCYVAPPCRPSYYSSYSTWGPSYSVGHRRVYYRRGGCAPSVARYRGYSYRSGGSRYYSSRDGHGDHYRGPSHGHYDRRGHTSRHGHHDSRYRSSSRHGHRSDRHGSFTCRRRH